MWKINRLERADGSNHTQTHTFERARFSRTKTHVCMSGDARCHRASQCRRRLTETSAPTLGETHSGLAHRRITSWGLQPGQAMRLQPRWFRAPRWGLASPARWSATAQQQQRRLWGRRRKRVCANERTFPVYGIHSNRTNAADGDSESSFPKLPWCSRSGKSSIPKFLVVQSTDEHESFYTFVVPRKIRPFIKDKHICGRKKNCKIVNNKNKFGNKNEKIITKQTKKL